MENANSTAGSLTSGGFKPVSITDMQPNDTLVIEVDNTITNRTLTFVTDGNGGTIVRLGGIDVATINGIPPSSLNQSQISVKGV